MLDLEEMGIPSKKLTSFTGKWKPWAGKNDMTCSTGRM